MLRSSAAWVCAVVFASPVAVGFAQDPSLPRFDVASVKPNSSGSPISGLSTNGGELKANNNTVRQLIGIAFGEPLAITPSRMIGGPSWIDADRFDIMAKPESGVSAPPAQIRLMLRSLLIERFKLVVHNETRELPIFELVLVRGDGKLGAQLVKSDVDCIALATARGGAPPPLPLSPSGPSDRPSCGGFFNFTGRMSGTAVTIETLTTVLSRMVNRPVVNKTGLAGTYNLDMTFTPEQLPSAPPPGAPALPPIDPTGPSIYTALQEQLGLKLNSGKGPVEVLVIDHVEHPREP